MTGVLIQYLIGLYLVGISLDAPRANVAKIIGGVILIVTAVVGITIVRQYYGKGEGGEQYEGKKDK